MTLLTVQDLDNFDTLVNHSTEHGGAIKLAYQHKSWSVGMNYYDARPDWLMCHPELTGALKMAADNINAGNFPSTVDTIENATRLPAMHTRTGRFSVAKPNLDQAPSAFPHQTLEGQGYPPKSTRDILDHQVTSYLKNPPYDTAATSEAGVEGIGNAIHSAMEAHIDAEVEELNAEQQSPPWGPWGSAGRPPGH